MSGLPATFRKNFHDEELCRRMEYRPLGGTGLQVSKLALGCGTLSSFYGDLDVDEAVKTIHLAIKSGINYLDTAPFYGQGRSEEVLGLALKDVPRETYYIATKVGRYTQTYAGMFDFSAKKTRESVNKSLQLMGLDYVDIIQIHDIEFAKDLDVVLNECLPELERLVNEGKARFIGVTGYPVKRLKECIAQAHGRFDTVLSYARNTLLDDTLQAYVEYFREQNLGIICASGHALGLLTNDGPQPWHPADEEQKQLCRKAANVCKEANVELGKLAMYHCMQLAGPATFLTGSGVMQPVTRNVMDIIRQREDMSIMRTVLEKTKLSELLEGEKPVTIFVPNDAAFEKLEPHLRRVLKEGKGCASNILKNHILDLTFCSVASVPGAKTTAYNILGEAMRFNRSKTADKSEVSDLSSMPMSMEGQQSPVVINGIAKIIEADVMGTNGVVHVIDTIIPTSSALPLSTLMQEKNVTIFQRLLEASGLDEKFDDLDNVTVFAPTDKAFQSTKWPKILAETPDQLKNNDELAELINYHVVSPMTKTCDLSEQLLPTATGEMVRINLYSTHALFSNVMNRATVNCARLVHFDDESCGSVLHQVDKVLTAPKMNLLQALESNPNYSRFLELVRAANLTSLLMNEEQSFTLLVPKNEVFEEVSEWERALTQDPQQLESLIKTHIVNDVVCCAGIIPTNWPFVRTIESLNGAHLHITRERRPKIENAGVTKCDAVSSNGIIHEINDIIVPSRRNHRTQPPQPQPQPQPQHPQHHRVVDPFGDIFF